MAIPSNITNEQQAEILNALNKFFDREYDYTYSSLSDAVDSNGLIGIAYTEYEDEEDAEFFGCSTVQVSYDLNTEEYVYALGSEDGVHEERQSVVLAGFIKDLNICDFNDFVRF
jgi:hypothetical protein